MAGFYFAAGALATITCRPPRGHASTPLSSAATEQHAIRLGDAAIATNPFEYSVYYGVQIKARSPAVQTFVVQPAGGGYLPTERAIAGKSYGRSPPARRSARPATESRSDQPVGQGTFVYGAGALDARSPRGATSVRW